MCVREREWRESREEMDPLSSNQILQFMKDISDKFDSLRDDVNALRPDMQQQQQHQSLNYSSSHNDTPTPSPNHTSSSPPPKPAQSAEGKPPNFGGVKPHWKTPGKTGGPSYSLERVGVRNRVFTWSHSYKKSANENMKGQHSQSVDLGSEEDTPAGVTADARVKSCEGEREEEEVSEIFVAKELAESEGEPMYVVEALESESQTTESAPIKRGDRAGCNNYVIHLINLVKSPF